MESIVPFAVDEGLVPVTEPVTKVRIFNTNTKKIIEADVPVRDGKALTEGYVYVSRKIFFPESSAG